MFVKVIYENGKDEVVHECKRYRIRRLQGDDHFFVVLDGNTELEFAKGSNAEVFAMNSEGRTVEVIRRV